MAEEQEDINGDTSAPILVPLLAVGLSDIPDSVTFLKGNTIAYVVGRCVATFSQSKQRPSRISQPLHRVRQITTLAISADRKYVAVAEILSMGPPQITILEVPSLDRLVSVACADVVHKYTSVCFSGDGEALVACSFDDEKRVSMFVKWEWRTSLTPICTGHVSDFIKKVSIDPKNASNIVTQLTHEVVLWRQASGIFRRHDIDHMPPKSDMLAYIDHCWMATGSHFLIATNQKELLMVERTNMVEKISVDKPIIRITCASDGTIIVGTDACTLQLWAKKRGVTHYTLYAEISAPTDRAFQNALISSMSPTLSGDKLVVHVRNGSIYMLNLAFTRTTAFHRENSGELWEVVLPGPHTGEIVSASMAIKRDVLVTASADLTVRVWSYSPLRLVAVHHAHIKPTSVSIDPWGRELVVAYVDCVRYYNLVEGMLLDVGEVRQPREGHTIPLEHVTHVSHNPSGSLIAMVGGQDEREIMIYSTLHKQWQASLKGHFSPVQDLAWSEDGLYLASTSEGSIFTWSMDGFQKQQENTVKAFHNNSVSVDSKFRHMVVGDTYSGLRIATSNRGDPDEAELLMSVYTDDSLTIPNAPTMNPTKGKGRSSRAKKASSRTDVFVVGGVGSQSRVSGRALGGYNTDDEDSNSVKTVADLKLHRNFLSIMMCNRHSLSLIYRNEMKVVVGGGAFGRVRVCPYPPRNNEEFSEYAIHTSDVTSLLVHPSGRLVFTTDATGVWMMHALVARSEALRATAQVNTAQTKAIRGPPRAPISRVESAVKERDEDEEEDEEGAPERAFRYSFLLTAASKTVNSAIPEANDDLDIISVRAVDVQLLKESLREVKDSYTKSVSDMQYRLYEKEAEVRRSNEAEIRRLKQELESVQMDVTRVKTEAVQKMWENENMMEDMAEKHEKALQAQKAKYESKLDHEIDRTNAAETATENLKSKFGRRLWEVEKACQETGKEAKSQIHQTEESAKQAVSNAAMTIEKSKAENDLIYRVDAEMNEEEVSRVFSEATRTIEEKDAMYMSLMLKYQMQKTLLKQKTDEAKSLKDENEKLMKEAIQSAEALQAAEEELRRMVDSWRERDLLERQREKTTQGMASQLGQNMVFTALASTRIREMNDAMEPMRKARDAALEQLAVCEAAQTRQLEQNHRLMEEKQKLEDRLENALRGQRDSRQQVRQRELYFDNFVAQMWRTVQEMPVTKWAGIFGRLYDDWTKGKDSMMWSKYYPKVREDDNEHSHFGESAPNRPVPTSPGHDMEAEAKMTELKRYLLQSEDMMGLIQETHDKELKNFRQHVQRLVSENTSLLAELNESKRTIKDLHEALDKMHVEAVHTRTFNPSQGGILRPPKPKQGGLLEMAALNTAMGAGPRNTGSGHAPERPPPSAPTILEDQELGVEGSYDVGSSSVGPGGSIGGSRPVSRGPPVKSEGGRSPFSHPPSRLGTPGSASVDPPSTPGNRHISDGGSAAPPVRVTGDMPTSGWWLSDKMFEVSGSLLKTEPGAVTTRKYVATASSNGRPGSQGWAPQTPALSEDGEHGAFKRATSFGWGDGPEGGQDPRHISPGRETGEGADVRTSGSAPLTHPLRKSMKPPSAGEPYGDGGDFSQSEALRPSYPSGAPPTIARPSVNAVPPALLAYIQSQTKGAPGGSNKVTMMGAGFRGFKSRKTKSAPHSSQHAAQ